MILLIGLCLFILLQCAKNDDKNLSIVQKKSSYCRKQYKSLVKLKKLARKFWHLAKKNKHFKNALKYEIKKLKLDNDKRIYKTWLKTIIARATNQEMLIHARSEHVFLFISTNSRAFYMSMQFISQFIDFSDKKNDSIITALVEDLVDTIIPHFSSKVNELPTLDSDKLRLLFSKIIQLGKELSKLEIEIMILNYLKLNDQFRSDDARNKLRIERNNLKLERVFNVDDLCYNHGSITNLLYNDNYIDNLHTNSCNLYWVNCQAKRNVVV